MHWDEILLLVYEVVDTFGVCGYEWAKHNHIERLQSMRAMRWVYGQQNPGTYTILDKFDGEVRAMAICDEQPP